METEVTSFHRADSATRHDAARPYADALHAHLSLVETRDKILLANVPRSSSAVVQDAFLPFALEMGFTSEKKGLFDRYEPRNLRPDYYRPLPPDGGILLEVERGKTTRNNMDLLDLWKTHICDHADVLFLVVPRELRHNKEQVRPTNEFASVCKRLGTFFEAGNETNVAALFVFGY